ncbi:MAG: DUF2934 domain-containing protein [Nitrospirae bacterium]|nr:DUF2934 domain-containing protein [Nitrospirota bacterium]
MAKSIEKTMLPAEESSSKPSIDLHEIDLHKNESQGLSEKISGVAYDLFLKKGAAHGNDLGDWLEAEQMVLAQIKSEEKK